MNLIQWTAGESNPDCLGANQASSLWTSGPLFYLQRSVRELNPVFLPTEEVCCRNTYRPSSSISDPGWNRTIVSWMSPRRLCPWTTGSFSSVAGVGIEPTKSQGSRPCRFANLRTRPCKWRVRGLHPAFQAYETLELASKVAGPGIEPGTPALWEPVGHLPRLQSVSDQGESRTPMPCGTTF